MPLLFRSWPLLAGLALAALAVPATGQAPAAAAPSAPAQVASPSRAVPANSVHCVFDNLSIEDREITLMLIGLDFLDQGKYTRVAPANRIVDRLVAEALPACAGAYRWPAAASDAAIAYAHSSLVQEVVRQALDSDQRKVDPIESYYVTNRSAFTGRVELDEMQEEGFATHLQQAGWKEGDRELRRLARVYLEVLIARDRTEQAFATAGTARPPVKLPARRARTAKRDRP